MWKLQNRLSSLRARLRNLSRRKLLIGGVIALGLSVVVGHFYYNSSSRVLNDALVKFATAKTADFAGTTTFTFSDGQQSVKVNTEFTGGGAKNEFMVNTKTKISVGAVDLNVDLDLAADQEAMYFKLDNATELADAATAALGENPPTEVYQLAERLDNTWIKVDHQINNEQYGCSLDELNSIAMSEQSDLRRIFEQNQFIKAKRSSFGFTEQEYTLSLDETAAKRFGQELMRTEYFQKLEKNCSFNSTAPASAGNPLEHADFNAKIWVNPWTHAPKRFMITAKAGKTEFTLETSIHLGRRVAVNIPKSALTIEQLLQESPQEPGSFLQEEIEDQQPDADEMQLELQATDVSGSESAPPTQSYPQKLEVRPRPEVWD